MACGLAVREFNEPSREWAKFVMNNRNRKFESPPSAECNHLGQYDVVYGPAANDRIAASFQLYRDEMITADELTARLKYRKLNDQYSFHTERAVALLKCRGISMNDVQYLKQAAVRELASYLIEDEGCNLEESLEKLSGSSTFGKVLDEKTGLYLAGSAHAYEYLKEELGIKRSGEQHLTQ